MIRVAHVSPSADTHAGGTTTAFFNILEAISTFPDQVQVSAYFERPPEGDPAWKTISRTPIASSSRQGGQEAPQW